MVLQRKRSLLLGLGLTVALVLSVALLPATASASNSFAVGGGTTSIIGTHFAFSAHCKLATGVCPPAPGRPRAMPSCVTPPLARRRDMCAVTRALVARSVIQLSSG